MNPFSGEIKGDVQRITQRTMETFSKEYLRAFKTIAIRDAKNARRKKPIEDSSEEEPRVIPSTPEDPHRPRLKNRYAQDVVPELKARITTWTTLDSDVDPFIVYIVETSLGDRSSSVYRRYNDFKDLNKKMGKKNAEAKKLFPSAKTFEGRKFEYDYVYERKVKLQKYLDVIINDKELHKEEYLIKWLGLNEPEDRRSKEVFELAFTNTKWRLWIWKRIYYDDEEEAISKIVIEEIRREIMEKIISDLPNQAQIRSTALVAVYRTITATVGPIVAAGWKAAREAVAPIQPKITEIIDNAMDKLLEVEQSVKDLLTSSIIDGLKPISEQLQVLLKALGSQLMDPGFGLLKELYPSHQALIATFDKVIDTGNEKDAEDIERLVKEGRMEAEERVNKMLEKQLEAVIGDLSKHVTVDALSSLFSPLKKFIDLTNNVFDIFFNPTPHVPCIKTLCEYRLKLEELIVDDNDFTEKVNDILEREEGWLMWRRWWTYWEYRWKAWSIYWMSYGTPELVAIADILQRHAFEYAKVQKKWIKKWSFRFGDHLYERSKKATQETWKMTVRECFAIGFAEANIYLKKRAFEILHEMVIDFFFAAIGKKVEEVIMKIVGPMLEDIQKKVVVSPIDEVINVETIVQESINDALKREVTQIVDNSIVLPYVESFSQMNF